MRGTQRSWGSRAERDWPQKIERVVPRVDANSLRWLRPGKAQRISRRRAPWLKDPKAKVPGTKMTFPGLKDPKQIDDVVAYPKQKRLHPGSCCWNISHGVRA